MRDGRKKNLNVVLEAMPNDEVLLSSNESTNTNELGIEVSELTRSNRRKYGIKNNEQGVIVTRVDDPQLHKQHLEKVFDALVKEGLHVKQSKCHLFCKSIIDG